MERCVPRIAFAGRTAMGALALALVASSSARAQSATAAQPPARADLPRYPTQSTPVSPYRVTPSAAGEAGRRQTRDQEIGNIAPAARISNRVANRVQSRLRNRIDRNYDPQANASSPFAVAEARSRTAGQAPDR